MGKRELVLIALFAVVGIVVYQATAPPAPPGSDLSAGGIFQRMRRSVQGNRATATGQSTQTIVVPAAVRTLRINLRRPCDVTITGGDGDRIEVAMTTSARGYTQPEAKAAADAAKVKAETTADVVALTGEWEDHRGPAGFVTQVSVTITVPRRLSVSLQPHIGALTAKGLAGLEATSNRGDTHVLDTAGDVVVTHLGGPLEIAGAATLTLTARNGRGEVSRIAGRTRVDANRSRLTLSELTGPLEIESSNSELSLEKIGALKPGLRYNGNGGELRIDGLRVESRIDGHNTDIDVRLDAAAPVTIYNLGAIRVTPPPGGYTLDAAASEGRITGSESGITPSEGPDSRASGKVRGGGPPLTLRATRGRIDLRSRSETETPSK